MNYVVTSGIQRKLLLTCDIHVVNSAVTSVDLSKSLRVRSLTACKQADLVRMFVSRMDSSYHNKDPQIKTCYVVSLEFNIFLCD